MPYTNVPDDKQDAMESCVEKVMAKGHEKESAIGICYTSVVEGKSLGDAFQAWLDDKLSTSAKSAMKIGAMISQTNMKKVQAAHDAMVEMGAACGEAGKSISPVKFTKMYEMGAADYAMGESWNIIDAASALIQVSNLARAEVDEPNDINKLCNIMRGLIDFISGQIGELEQAALKVEHKSFAIPKDHKLDLSYVKSLEVEIPENKLAVKYVGKNIVAHPVFIWGDKDKTDLAIEFFTKDSDFWDEPLKDYQPPLTWDHGQDELFIKFEDNPVIGKTVKHYDDDIARWAESVIETDKKYRKFIDQFIEEKRLGYSSDTAPQYVIREQQGKAIWLKSWPWFGGALTAAPCEPRMKIYTPEFLKSLGVQLPDVNESRLRFEHLKRQSEYLKLKER